MHHLPVYFRIRSHQFMIILCNVFSQHPNCNGICDSHENQYCTWSYKFFSVPFENPSCIQSKVQSDYKTYNFIKHCWIWIQSETILVLLEDWKNHWNLCMLMYVLLHESYVLFTKDYWYGDPEVNDTPNWKSPSSRGNI